MVPLNDLSFAWPAPERQPAGTSSWAAEAGAPPASAACFRAERERDVRRAPRLRAAGLQLQRV